MPNILRCLAALSFFAATAHAQPKGPSDTTELIQTLGLPAVLGYSLLKDFGPGIMRRLKEPRVKGGPTATDLDKADAVMGINISNLVKSFDEHVEEDRDNFKGLRDSTAEIQEGIGELKGMLRVMQQTPRN